MLDIYLDHQWNITHLCHQNLLSSSAAGKYPYKDKPAVLCHFMAMSLTSLFMPMKLEPSQNSIL